MKNQKTVITNSSIHAFMTCRQKYDYRYNHGIVRSETADALKFGSAIHQGLEFWFKYQSQKAAIEAADCDGLSITDQIKAQELLKKYTEIYAVEDFSVIDIESVFETPIINPATNRKSRKMVFSGKVDGIIQLNNEIWILEHKTASNPDDDYFSSKMFDDQIMFYALALQAVLKKPVVGALYDVIVKPRVEYKEGETDEEFQSRLDTKAKEVVRIDGETDDEYDARVKKATARLKKKEGETLDEFRERVASSITEKNFKRKWILFDEAALYDKKSSLWHVSRDIEKGEIYQNTSACMSGYGACEYCTLCKNRGDLSKCENIYETKQIHCELNV